MHAIRGGREDAGPGRVGIGIIVAPTLLCVTPPRRKGPKVRRLGHLETKQGLSVDQNTML